MTWALEKPSKPSLILPTSWKNTQLPESISSSVPSPSATTGIEKSRSGCQTSMSKFSGVLKKPDNLVLKPLSKQETLTSSSHPTTLQSLASSNWGKFHGRSSSLTRHIRLKTMKPSWLKLSRSMMLNSSFCWQVHHWATIFGNCGVC